MDETWKAFEAHIHKLERFALAGDVDAAKSLACMVLIREGFPTDDDPGGGEVIDLVPYLRAA